MFRKLAVPSCAIWCIFTLTSFAVSQDRIPRILNGDATDEFESVGIIGSVNRGGFCTGTLNQPVPRAHGRTLCGDHRAFGPGNFRSRRTNLSGCNDLGAPGLQFPKPDQ